MTTTTATQQQHNSNNTTATTGLSARRKIEFGCLEIILIQGFSLTDYTLELLIEWVKSASLAYETTFQNLFIPLKLMESQVWSVCLSICLTKN